MKFNIEPYEEDIKIAQVGHNQWITEADLEGSRGPDPLFSGKYLVAYIGNH